MSSPDIQDTPRIVSPTGAPLYKVAPVTKILVEPSKALKSPFLVKRQSLHRPDTKVLEGLYHDITTNPSPIWQYLEDLPELVKIEKMMNDEKKQKKEIAMSNWLNFVVSNMGREDARDFWNTKCLGWRHYADSKWAEKSMSRHLDPKDLKKVFYAGSVLYNASQSHMVFIPVFHDHQWTLYAFNMCDQKLSILDSRPDTTKGADPTKRHQKTRCNICDALTVTMNYAIDFRSWEYQFPKVPRQQDSGDSGFFVFNFMRLWDGHQLVRWFPTESRELRKDFLAYILLCKDDNVNLPDEVSLKIKNLPGEMMDCILHKVAMEGTRLGTGNQGEHVGVGPSNNAPSDHSINVGTELEASTESSNELANAHSSSRREAAAASSTGYQGEHGGVGSSNNAPSDHSITLFTEPEASTESSNELDDAYSSSSREADAALGYQGEQGSVPADHSITMTAEPDASAESSNELTNAHSSSSREVTAAFSTGYQGEHGGVSPSNNGPSDHKLTIEVSTVSSSVLANAHASSTREVAAASGAPDPALASYDFLSTCHRVTSDGDGVLHIAARFGNVELLHDILENHETLAEVLLLAVNNSGDTPLHCAAARGGNDIGKLFLGHLMKEDTDTVTANLGWNTIPRFLNRDTTLNRAAPGVKYFLKNMEDENKDGIAMFLRAQNLKGETCLHEAVRHGHAEIVKALISMDEKIDYSGWPALVQIVDNEGISPLYLATTIRRIEIVEALTRKQNKYSASFAGPAGKTALHAAVVLLDEGLVEILLKWKAGLTSQVDESGSTPLHFLASLSLERREHNTILFLLYKLQRDLNIVIKFLCCKPPQDSGIVEFIMEKDPLSALYVDCTGSMPIHIAAAHGRLDTVKKLLKECSYCETSRNASGQTFLHVAVEKEKLNIVDYVCGEKKFNKILNAEDQDGNTALHLAVNSASEKVVCTLMQNREVCLNFANKEGRTPLDLAFLRLHPDVICMKGPREWIFFDLLHGGGDFGVGSWDQLAKDVVKPDWEKESERVGKSASMLAVCAVLILNAALLAPFNVIKQMDKDAPFNMLAFQTFVVSDSIAFVCSAAATYFCARAGFAMSDGWARLKNLITGTFALVVAALGLMITVALALFLVLPGGTGFLPILIAGLGIFSQLFFGFLRSWVTSTFAHLRAIRARAGTLRLVCILLFQHSAIQPVWVVPSGSTSLLWSVAFVVAAFAITISLTTKFAGGA
ncbi:uncharacterized protein LOC125535220 [Triticum urartu]|nr:uncharacterized protein LOC125535220 [Triticum urartu]